MARSNQQGRKKKQPKKKKVEEVVEEEVVEEEEEVEDNDQIESDNSDDSNDDDGSDDDASESESESDGEDDVAASLFKGQAEEDDNDDDSDGEEDTDDANASSSAMQNEAFTFDLRNMLAINTDQLAMGAFYDAKKSKSTNGKEIEIPLDPIRGKALEVNEDYLLSKATDGCTELIRSLWELPTEVSDAGPLVTLPTYDEIRLPRAMVRTRRSIAFFEALKQHSIFAKLSFF